MGSYALLTADVGPPERYHVGDQAIMTANLESVRSFLPLERVSIFAADPSFSAANLGVATVEPPSNDRVRRALAKGAWRKRGPVGSLLSKERRALQAVSRASLLHLCGGGNLTSLFGHEVRRRSLYALAAIEAGVPVVVTGQTLGPELDEDDRELLGRWLPHVAHLGVRDRASAKLARQLAGDDAAVSTVVDDAFLLSGEEARLKRREESIPGEGPLVGLSLHHRKSSEVDREAMRKNLAAALDGLAASSEARFLFLSHMHAVAGPARQWDLEFGKEVRDEMAQGDRVRLVDEPLLDRQIKWLSASCDLFLSTRYHGAVFALSSGVPTVLLTQDRHTRIKMRGLVEVLGIDSPVLAADSPEVADAAQSTWDGRTVSRGPLEAAVDRARAAFLKERQEIAAHYRRALDDAT